MSHPIIAIDPGCEQSAWLIHQGGKILDHGKATNQWLIDRVRTIFEPRALLCIEMIASYGMPVGREVFDTCLYIGMLYEAWQARGGEVRLIYRKDVKLFHCQSTRANDSNIRAAIIDTYGPGKDRAIGKKASPGPLFGIKADVWSALAIAMMVSAQQQPLPARPF